MIIPRQFNVPREYIGYARMFINKFNSKDADASPWKMGSMMMTAMSQRVKNGKIRMRPEILTEWERDWRTKLDTPARIECNVQRQNRYSLLIIERFFETSRHAYDNWGVESTGDIELCIRELGIHIAPKVRNPLYCMSLISTFSLHAIARRYERCLPEQNTDQAIKEDLIGIDQNRAIWNEQEFEIPVARGVWKGKLCYYNNGFESEYENFKQTEPVMAIRTFLNGGSLND